MIHGDKARLRLRRGDEKALEPPGDTASPPQSVEGPTCLRAVGPGLHVAVSLHRALRLPLLRRGAQGESSTLIALISLLKGASGLEVVFKDS